MATCIHQTIKNFNPPVSNAGTISNTPFQKELKVKIGAKVMLTYNIDTSDGLTNGARGDLVGVIEDDKGNISKLIIRFEVEANGKNKRCQNQQIANQYQGGTPIDKVNFPFSISKSKKSLINTAYVVQFPVKLAFACTSHKIQGATIHKPLKIIIDVQDIFMAAMVYVMLSRVCTLWQVLILNNFDESKMYPSQVALRELERLEKESRIIHSNENEEKRSLKIFSLNCRSLKKHHLDIVSDCNVLNNDIICLQETWLDDDTLLNDLEIPSFKLYLNSNGKGKGIAAYVKNNTFKHETDIKEENMQISKFSSPIIDIMIVYRSQNGEYSMLNQNIETLTSNEKPQLIIGDFNFCHKESSNLTKRYFQQQNFSQLVKDPTHIEGNLLDHAYLSDTDNVIEYKTELQIKYYTDHKGISVVIDKK